MEVRRLDERIGLLHGDLLSLRDEIRDGFATRPTHSDLGAAKLLLETKIEHAYEAIRSLNRSVDEDKKHKRQLTISLICVGLTAAVSIILALFT